MCNDTIFWLVKKFKFTIMHTGTYIVTCLVWPWKSAVRPHNYSIATRIFFCWHVKNILVESSSHADQGRPSRPLTITHTDRARIVPKCLIGLDRFWSSWSDRQWEYSITKTHHCLKCIVYISSRLCFIWTIMCAFLLLMWLKRFPHTSHW